MTDAGMTRRDRMIPWYFVMFFVALAIIDGVFVSLAVRTNSGVVTDHPYEKGLAYNKVVQAEEQQEALGWKGELTFHKTTEHAGNVALTVKDKAGKSLVVESGTLAISRPTQSGKDFEAKLEHGKAVVAFPLPGQWEVRAFATVAGKSYQVAKRIVIE